MLDTQKDADLELTESADGGDSLDDLRRRWRQPSPGGEGTLRDQTLEMLRSNCVVKSSTQCVVKSSQPRSMQMDLRGISLVGHDLTDLNLSGYDLSGADLSRADLSRSNLSRVKMHRGNLRRAKLNGTEFSGADLRECVLNECIAERCGLGATNLQHASLISARMPYASLSRADLSNADCRAIDLTGARINEANLSGASFIRANMQKADLKASDVKGTSFELTDLSSSRLLTIKNFQKANWIGADIRDMDLRGAYMVRRHIADENYLYEFKTRSQYHKYLYYVWLITSDCGRSLLRWAFWVMGFTVLFGFLYQLVEVDYGDHPTSFSPFYYSVVTLTTLGYGDAVPGSVGAQILAVIQALLGYLGLGGLLSILSNKLARRAE